MVEDKRKQYSKTVNIIYNQSLTQVQGINYVNNSFVQGKDYFLDNDLTLEAVYAPDMVFNCEGKTRMDTIGFNMTDKSYIRQRKFRTVLKKIFSSRSLVGSSIKLYFNFYKNAKLSVERYLSSGKRSDYLLFQDFLSAHYYLNHRPDKDETKLVLLLHCSNDPLEQMSGAFPGWFRYGNLERKIRLDLESSMHGVDKVVYLSRHAFDKSPLRPEDKYYVYNGIQDIPHVVLKKPDSQLKLVCVANVSEHKGQRIVIEAMSYLKKEILDKLHFYIVGGGYYLPTCKMAVNDAGLQDYVSFYGIRNDVPEILKEMDVFILPSRSEGMPMSILEALRQGLYILATGTGAIPEMLDDSFGKIITRDPKNLASVLESLVNNNLVTFESRNASREKFLANFTLQEMICSYSKVLKSL